MSNTVTILAPAAGAVLCLIAVPLLRLRANKFDTLIGEITHETHPTDELRSWRFKILDAKVEFWKRQEKGMYVGFCICAVLFLILLGAKTG